MINGWEYLPENGPIKSMDSSCLRIEFFGDEMDEMWVLQEYLKVWK